MERPDKRPRRQAQLQTEVMEAMVEHVTEVVVRLPPGARLRLLAFLHLLERPENTSASFDLSEAGLMRLTLTCPVDEGATAIN